MRTLDFNRESRCEGGTRLYLGQVSGGTTQTVGYGAARLPSTHFRHSPQKKSRQHITIEGVQLTSEIPWNVVNPNSGLKRA